MSELWSFVTGFFSNIGSFWFWLNAPLYPEYLGDLAPIHLFSVGGLMILVALWIFKLVNPFS